MVIHPRRRLVRHVSAGIAVLAMAIGPLVSLQGAAGADESVPSGLEASEDDQDVPPDGAVAQAAVESDPAVPGPVDHVADTTVDDGSDDEQGEGVAGGAAEPPPGDVGEPVEDVVEEESATEGTDVPPNDPSGEAAPAVEDAPDDAASGGDAQGIPDAVDDEVPAVEATAAEAAPAVTAVEGDLVVDKLVDADGDGTFADDEDAHSATSDVTFRVTLTNLGDATLEVTSVVDLLSGETLDLLAADACPSLATVLEADASVTCDVVLERYLRTFAQPPRSRLTNVVEVVASDGEATLTASDDATVRNPNALVVVAAVDLTNDADGNGTFTDDEQAPSAGSDVPIRIEVANRSPGAVSIVGLTGDWGEDGPVDLLATACPQLDGMRLWGVGGGHEDAGDHDDGAHDDGDHDDGTHDDGHDGGGGGNHPTTAVCLTSLAGHAPLAGSSRTDTVTVTLGKRHSPDRRASADDSTTVRVAAPTQPPTEPPTEPPTQPPTQPATSPDEPTATSTSSSVPSTVDRTTTRPPAVTTASTVSGELAHTGLPLGPLAASALATLLAGLALLAGAARVRARARVEVDPHDRPG